MELYANCSSIKNSLFMFFFFFIFIEHILQSTLQKYKEFVGWRTSKKKTIPSSACSRNNYYGEVEEQFHTLILRQTPQQNSQLLRAHCFHPMP